MCSGSEAGSYLRLIDCVYHSTLGLRVIKKKKNDPSKASLEKISDGNVMVPIQVSSLTILPDSGVLCDQICTK